MMSINSGLSTRSRDGRKQTELIVSTRNDEQLTMQAPHVSGEACRRPGSQCRRWFSAHTDHTTKSASAIALNQNPSHYTDQSFSSIQAI